MPVPSVRTVALLTLRWLWLSGIGVGLALPASASSRWAQPSLGGSGSLKFGASSTSPCHAGEVLR